MSSAKRGSSATARGKRRDCVALALSEVRSRLLVRAVLEEAGEQQVARLQQREVLLVLHLGRRQQPGRLEVEQRGRDNEELRCLAEVPGRAEGADIRDELVRHLGQGDLGDVELVLGDQREQEVERALEVRQPHLERPGRPSPDATSAVGSDGAVGRPRAPGPDCRPGPESGPERRLRDALAPDRAGQPTPRAPASMIGPDAGRARSGPASERPAGPGGSERGPLRTDDGQARSARPTISPARSARSGRQQTWSATVSTYVQKPKQRGSRREPTTVSTMLSSQRRRPADRQDQQHQQREHAEVALDQILMRPLPADRPGRGQLEQPPAGQRRQAAPAPAPPCRAAPSPARGRTAARPARRRR